MSTPRMASMRWGKGNATAKHRMTKRTIHTEATRKGRRPSGVTFIDPAVYERMLQERNK